jgi:hypothetical protein
MAAPALPASTVAQTNTSGQNALVTVSGGTVTVVSVGGVPVGSVAGTFLVPAGGTIAVTYAVAPAWTWLALP